MNKINVIAVVGPTASGKTSLAVALAKKFNGEVVSADSMQIYKGMEIATAKPTKAEMDNIPHHLIDFVDPNDSYSVGQYVQDAEKAILDINSRNKTPIICGGTGLYVDSLLNGISFTENSSNPQLQKQLNELACEKGVDYLLSMLKEFDPESFKKLSVQKNQKRIVRAIEFYKTTGKAISQQVAESKINGSMYNPVIIGLNAIDRQFIYDRINKRVDLMMNLGLLEEAKAVISSDLSRTSCKAIGYKELMPYFNNEKTLDECIEKLKMETRRYAKRQLTWFRRNENINWLYIDGYNSFEELLNDATNIISEKRNLNG